MYFFVTYFFILGLIVGSFLNVLILRYNTGRSLAGRSGCFSCGHSLSWFELVPLGSFIWQRGRCRHCGSRISGQYPAVEFLTGLLFALSAWKFYPSAATVGVYAALLAVLVVLVAHDLRHQIIADGPAYSLIGLAVLALIVKLSAGGVGSAEIGKLLLPNFIAGIVLFGVFFGFWYFSRGRLMGGGDAKLALAIGILLGPAGGVNAIVLAFCLGAVVGLALIGAGKLSWAKKWRRFSIKSEIPFAPFLAAGLILNLFFGLSIIFF
jgi:leader peptidase (prepilin peptidase)/N-methyltransferase